MPRRDAMRHHDWKPRGPAHAESTGVTQGSARRTLGIVLCSVIAVTTGCQTRYVAPEVPYDPAQVQKIRQTIDDIDWAEYE